MGLVALLTGLASVDQGIRWLKDRRTIRLRWGLVFLTAASISMILFMNGIGD